MRRIDGAFFALLLLGACGGRSESASPKTSAKASDLPQLPPAPRDSYAPPPPGTFPEAEDASLTPIDRPAHVRAREAARAGRLLEAKRLLGRLAAAYSDHPVLVDQYNAVSAMIEKARAASKASLEASPLRTLEPPPVKYTLARPSSAGAASGGASDVPKLVKTSQKKNGITDDEAWFARNDAHLPLYFVPPPTDMLFAPGAVSSETVANTLTRFIYTEYTPSGRFLVEPLPIEIPLSYGTAPLREAIDSKPYILAIYGERIVAVFDAPDHVAGLFDFANYVHPPADREGKVVVGRAELRVGEQKWSGDLTATTHTITHKIQFALAKDGVLYVQHANLSYAKENKGQTGYVSAIDLTSGALLWRSAPLVANAQSFSVVRGGLVTGYGFTAEPDFVYVLDLATGVTKQVAPVSTSPEVILLKGKSLLVRGYDTDFTFDVR